MLAMQKKLSEGKKFSPGQIVLKMTEQDPELGAIWSELMNVARIKNEKLARAGE